MGYSCLIAWDSWRNFQHPQKEYGLKENGIYKTGDNITIDDATNALKGLYDYLARRQRVKCAQGRTQRKKRKYIMLGVISQTSRGHMYEEQHESGTHIHLLVWGYECTRIISDIIFYWTTLKRYSYIPYYVKVFSANRIIYNISQAVVIKSAISPAIDVENIECFCVDADIKNMMIDIFTHDKRHIPKWIVIQAMYDWAMSHKLHTPKRYWTHRKKFVR